MTQPPPTSGADAVEGYAGERTPRDTFSTLVDDAAAVLVDVRTRPEWAYVGTVDLSGAAGSALALEWQRYPTMQTDTDFVVTLDNALRDAGRDKATPVHFLCRSGVRSLAAAKAMTAAGYTACYNITGGFEGDVDANGHRGRTNGWKADGLPWRQN